MTPSSERRSLAEALKGASAERAHWAALRWRHRHSDVPPPVVPDLEVHLGELWCAHRIDGALPLLQRAWKGDARLLRALSLLGGDAERSVLVNAMATGRPAEQRLLLGALVASGEAEPLQRLLSQDLSPAMWVHAVLREAPSEAALPSALLGWVEDADLEVWAAALEAPTEAVDDLQALWRQTHSWAALPAEGLLDLRSGLLTRRFAARAAGLASDQQILWWLPRQRRSVLGPLLREAGPALVPALQAQVRGWLGGRPWDAVEASMLPPAAAALATLIDDGSLLDLFEGAVPEALLELLLEQAPRLALERLATHGSHAPTAAVLVRSCVVHGCEPPELERWRGVVREAERRGVLEQRQYRRLARAAVADGMGRLRPKKRSKKKRR